MRRCRNRRSGSSVFGVKRRTIPGCSGCYATERPDDWWPRLMATDHQPPLWYPIRDEHVGLAHRGAVPIGGPHELRAVGAEHREAVELTVRRHLFEPGAVEVHEIQIEVAAARILVVRREDDAPAVRNEERREVGPAEVGNLPLIGSVG